MPRIYKRKYVPRKPAVKRLTRAKPTTRRTRTRRAPAVSSGGRSDGIQRFNPRGSRSFTINRTTVIGTVTTSPTIPFPVLWSPSSQLTPLYETYKDQFTKYRINSIKLRFELTTFEQTDDSVMPTIYIRRYEDPDLTVSGVTATTMMLQPRTIKKTFTASSNVLEFRFRPKIMYAGLQVAAGTYKPMPRTMGYVDSTQDITLFGVQYYVSAAGSNQIILITSEWDTTWAHPSYKTGL